MAWWPGGRSRPKPFRSLPVKQWVFFRFRTGIHCAKCFFYLPSPPWSVLSRTPPRRGRPGSSRGGGTRSRNWKKEKKREITTSGEYDRHCLQTYFADSCLSLSSSSSPSVDLITSIISRECTVSSSSWVALNGKDCGKGKGKEAKTKNGTAPSYVAHQ